MANVNPRALAREKRKKAIRRKIKGTMARPRLSVFRSARHIYAQIVDDEQGLTLTATSSLCPELKDKTRGKKKIEAAMLVGERIALLAREKGVQRVVFDRNGFFYHGRVKALSEAARKNGLEF